MGPAGQSGSHCQNYRPPEITGGGYGLALSRLKIHRGISLSGPGTISAFCTQDPP